MMTAVAFFIETSSSLETCLSLCPAVERNNIPMSATSRSYFAAADHWSPLKGSGAPAGGRYGLAVLRGRTLFGARDGVEHARIRRGSCIHQAILGWQITGDSLVSCLAHK